MQSTTFNTKSALLGSCLAWILMVSHGPSGVQGGGGELSELFQRQTGASCLSPSALHVPGAMSGPLKVRSRVDCALYCARDSSCSAYVYGAALGGACHRLDDVTGLTGSCGDFEADWQTWVRDTAAIQITATAPVCQNGGLETAAGECLCYNGHVGDLCERLMEDCKEGFDSGHYQMGAVPILLMAKPATSPSNITIMCIGTGSTVVLRQNYYYAGGMNFTWQEYVEGFTLPNEEGAHWIGLRNLFYVTNSKTYKLRLTITEWSGRTSKVSYSAFRLLDNVTFTASLGPSDGSGELSDPDLQLDVDGNPFSTYDHHNNYGGGGGDSNSNSTISVNGQATCAQKANGGWWYGSTCPGSYNLVGKFAPAEEHDEKDHYVFWEDVPAGSAGDTLKRFALVLRN